VYAVYTAFAGNKIQRYIPGLRSDWFDALAVVREADQQGPVPQCSLSHESERAIVIAAPHSEPVTVEVESDKRKQYHVDILRRLN
jgi:hypothetical protein